MCDFDDIDLVIFDCDGVIADSEVISAEVLIEEVGKFDVTLTSDYVFTHFVGKSFPAVADIIRETFKVDLPDSFEVNYRAALVPAFQERLQETPGISDVLQRLGRQCCVATSSSPPRVARTLSLLDMTDFFGSRVFTASQVKHGKPAPDLFLLAAETLGVAPKNCLVIEDSHAGLRAAKAAKMRVARYTGGAHLAGQSVAPTPEFADILHFDNWADFYLMAPQLQR